MHYFALCLEIRSCSRFLREIWISYFARRILEGIFVGGIVNIRNECLFFSVQGKWIAVRNKQIARFAVHAICLFRTAIHFPWTEKKKDTHSLIRPFWHTLVQRQKGGDLNIKTLKYDKRLLPRCIQHFKSDLINNMDHMRISGTEPSSVILSKKSIVKRWKWCQKGARSSLSQKGWFNKPTKLKFQ